MTDFLKKIKNNYHFIFLIAYFIVLLVIHSALKLNVIDDLPYYIAGNGSFSEIFSFLKWHYFNLNGRIIVHFFDVLMMRYDCILWKITNPLLLVLSAVLSAKIVENENFSFRKSLVAAVILYSIIDFEIMRTAVYWISASFNYLFTSVIVLFLAYLLKEKKYKPYLPFVAFIAGATMEQTSIVAFGLIFLIIIKSKIFEKEKLNVNLVLSLVTSFIGFLTLIFSPGTFKKFSALETEKSADSFIDVLYNNYLFGNWINKKSVIFTTVLSLSVILMLFYIQKCKKHFWGVHSAAALLLSVLTALNLLFIILNYRSGKLYSLSVIAFIIIFIFSLIYSGIYFMIKYKSCIPLISVILGIGSQIMLVIVNFVVTRIMFVAVVCFIIYILYSVSLWSNISKSGHIIILAISLILCITSISKSFAFIKSSNENYLDFPENFYSDTDKIEYIKNHSWYEDETVKTMSSWF